MLKITTEGYKCYQVNEQGEIKPEKNWNFSGQWIMLGITHVKHFEFIPLAELAIRISDLTLLYKNGKPQYTVVDMDHGTKRQWGDRVISLYFEADKC